MSHYENKMTAHALEIEFGRTGSVMLEHGQKGDFPDVPHDWMLPWKLRQLKWSRELVEETFGHDAHEYYYHEVEEAAGEMIDRACLGMLEDLRNDLTVGLLQRFFNWRLRHELDKRIKYFNG